MLVRKNKVKICRSIKKESVNGYRQDDFVSKQGLNREVNINWSTGTDF